MPSFCSANTTVYKLSSRASIRPLQNTRTKPMNVERPWHETGETSTFGNLTNKWPGMNSPLRLLLWMCFRFGEQGTRDISTEFRDELHPTWVGKRPDLNTVGQGNRPAPRVSFRTHGLHQGFLQPPQHKTYSYYLLTLFVNPA